MNQRTTLTGIWTSSTARFAAAAQHTQHGHTQLTADLQHITTHRSSVHSTANTHVELRVTS